MFMQNISADPLMQKIWDRTLHHALAMGRTLPEMRFFILDSMEFTSLLEKKVYPTSPVNIWEGKNMVTRKHRIENGQESSIYYEVVQTGNPSYAYLNHTNSPMMQASVMAHVVGHCEFSELNVLQDSDYDRTEVIMHLVRKVNLGRYQMGDVNYMNFWNACESVSPLIAPNSQYNIDNTVDFDSRITKTKEKEDKSVKKDAALYSPYSATMTALLKTAEEKYSFEEEVRKKIRSETINRKGYKLKAPCQDILGFLRLFAPMSAGEKSIMDYQYESHKHQDFVVRTQIMNEGWAMYWEKKIMMELFKEKVVDGIIDYAKVFSGVCYPRPYFARNPYHLGYHMWLHIEEMLRDGKLTLAYQEEKDVEKKENWKGVGSADPIADMTHIVKSCSDYEFLRRYLTPELVHKFHLNRIPKQQASQLGITQEDIIAQDRHYVWIDPEPIKGQMLNFFTHLYRPRLYIIDSDFQDGGLLIYHRNDNRKLKKEWIKPTLKNINLIWKAPVSIITDDTLYQYSASNFKESKIRDSTFNEVLDSIKAGEKPIKNF